MSARPGDGRVARRSRNEGLSSGATRSQNPLRVLMCHSYYRDLGGEDLSFEAEVELLRGYGHEVITYTRSNRELDRLGPLGSVRSGLRTIWARDAFRDVSSLVKRERPDMVHFQNTFPLISPSAFHAAHRLGVPVVVALRNYRLICVNGVLYRDGHVCEDCLHVPTSLPGVVHACYHGSRTQSAVVALMQSVHGVLGTWSAAVDVFVAPTAFTRGRFIEAGLPAEQIVVKANFVHPDPGENTAPGRWALYAGRLAPEKGVMTLLEAWRRSSPLPLRLVGDGPLHRSAEAFVARHGLEAQVEVLGSRAPGEVVELLREARIVIFPSEWYETFGRVAAEAFACGVPVITTGLGAMGEIVTDGVTGLHFRSGSAEDLTAKVAWAAEHDAEVRAMGHAARLEFERRYGADQNYHRLMEIYELARRVAAARQ